MGIVDKIVSGAKNTSNKISEEADVHSLKNKISDEKKLIDIAYRDMGSYYYTHRDKWTAADKKKVDEYCYKVDESLRRIADLEKEIEDTKTRGKQIRDANRMNS